MGKVHVEGRKGYRTTSLTKYILIKMMKVAAVVAVLVMSTSMVVARGISFHESLCTLRPTNSEKHIPGAENMKECRENFTHCGGKIRCCNSAKMFCENYADETCSRYCGCLYLRCRGIEQDDAHGEDLTFLLWSFKRILA